MQGQLSPSGVQSLVLPGHCDTEQTPPAEHVRECWLLLCLRAGRARAGHSGGPHCGHHGPAVFPPSTCLRVLAWPHGTGGHVALWTWGSLWSRCSVPAQRGTIPRHNPSLAPTGTAPNSGGMWGCRAARGRPWVPVELLVFCSAAGRSRGPHPADTCWRMSPRGARLTPLRSCT